MATTSVESAFVRRLGAAAAAAWWTFLVAVLIVTVQSTSYVWVVHCQVVQDWLSGLMGIDWDTLRWAICAFLLTVRLVIILMLLACIWLSLWARRLRRMGDA